VTFSALGRRAATPAPGYLFAVLGLGGGAVLGAVTASNAKYGVAAAAAVFLLTLMVRRPANVAIIALVGTCISQRIGGASDAPGTSGGLAISDVLLIGAAFLALPAMLSTREMRRLRNAFLGVAIYLACLMPSVMINSSTRAYLEWVHRLVLVGGSLLIGGWIVREGLTKAALRWLAAVSCLVALAAIENTSVHGLGPASPFGWHKNFIGALLAVVIVVVAAANDWLELRLRVQAFAILLLAGGLLASQSRGGILAAVAGLLVAYLVDPRGHSRRARTLALFVALGLSTFAFISVRDQLNQSQADRNTNSIGVRFNVEKETRRIWRTSPDVGVGLKYFVTGDYGPSAAAPNNVVDNELAESGVIGLAGFVVLQGTLLGVAFRRKREHKLVAVGLGVVTGLLLHGQVDIYWIAGSASLPFVILGMALAVCPADDGLSGQQTGRRTVGPHRSAATLA
jgi:hypothetical protein